MKTDVPVSGNIDEFRKFDTLSAIEECRDFFLKNYHGYRYTILQIEAELKNFGMNYKSSKYYDYVLDLILGNLYDSKEYVPYREFCIPGNGLSIRFFLFLMQLTPPELEHISTQLHNPKYQFHKKSREYAILMIEYLRKRLDTYIGPEKLKISTGQRIETIFSQHR